MIEGKKGGDDEPAKEERAGLVREIGSQAIWSLSSCKPGNKKNITSKIIFVKILCSKDLVLIN